MPGASNSTAEVTHVSRHGFWLLLAGEELLLPFAEFPWFRQPPSSSSRMCSGRRRTTCTGRSSMSISRSRPFVIQRRFR